MSTHTPAEQACFDALVEHNTERKPEDAPYPACLWPIAEAATKAVLDVVADSRRRTCMHTSAYRTQDGRMACDDCGRSE